MSIANMKKENHDIPAIITDLILLSIQLIWAIAEAIYRLIVPVAEKSVKGEIVLITGAGHGIGRQLALQYASKGATVVCWDINSKGNKETVKEINRRESQQAHDYVCDVGNRQQVMELYKRVKQEVGAVTILVNNAGVMPCRPFLKHSQEEIERILNVNVMSHFWTLQAILPDMIQRNSGHIVAISSCCGLKGMRNLVPYCASKYAIRGMMDALYCELMVDPGCQIKLTTIYPYIVNTGLCNKPNIRFPGVTPLLKASEVAESIITAQRRNMAETTVPRHLLSLFSCLKMFPDKVDRSIYGFMDIYVESDL